MQVPLFRLGCGVNSYEWGKKGSDSAAARFAAATPKEPLSIEPAKPYAEVRRDRRAQGPGLTVALEAVDGNAPLQPL